jgi:hypothetical protein
MDLDRLPQWRQPAQPFRPRSQPTISQIAAHSMTA